MELGVVSGIPDEQYSLILIKPNLGYWFSKHYEFDRMPNVDLWCYAKS